MRGGSIIANSQACPHLYESAMALLNLAQSEAAVERSFSIQGIHHSDLRNRSEVDLVQARMMVAFNHDALFNTPKPFVVPFAYFSLSQYAPAYF